MATERFANDIQTTLSAGINAAATSITVASATGFPSSAQYRVRIDNELLLITAGAGTNTWVVTRGIENSTAASHSSAAAVVHVVTAGALGTTSDPAADVPGLRTLGTGATQAASGDDARFGVGGVVGGTADDTAAMQAAMAGGGVVSLDPNEVYTVSNLILSPHTRFDGHGATIKRKSGATGPLFTNAATVTDIAASDTTFDNNNAAAGNPVFTFAAGSSLVTFDEQCAFINHNSAVVTCPGGTPSYWFKFLDSQWIGNASAGSNRGSLDLKDVHYVWYDRNYCENFAGFKDETSGPSPGALHHIFCRDNLFYNVAATCLEIRNNGAGGLADITVSGNHGYNIGNSSTQKGLTNLGEGVGASGSSVMRRVAVTGNVMKDYWGSGIQVGGGPTSGTMFDVTIADNILDATQASDNLPDLTRGSTIGIGTSNLNDFLIQNNIVHGSGPSGIRAVQDSVNGSKKGTIVGNEVSLCCQKPTAGIVGAEAGILLYGALSNVTVGFNHSFNHGSQAGQNTAGIGTDTHSAGTGASFATIIGNRCYDDRATPFQEWGIRLGHVAGAVGQPTNCTVALNNVAGNVTKGVKVFATGDPGHSIFHNPGDAVTKGTLTVADGTRIRELSPGVDNLVLTTDSGTALGLKWATSGGGPITKVVSADQTISASTTLTAITGLGVAIGTSATEIWLVKFWLLVNGANTTMDVKFGFTVPAACTMRWGYGAGGGQSSFGGWGATAIGTPPVVMSIESGAPPPLGTISGVIGVPIMATIFGGGTAGTAQIQYAQNTSDAGTLKILKGSAAEIVPLSS